MDKQTTTIIAVVAVVAVVAVAAFFVLGNNSKDYSDTEIGEIGTYVPIYGNATGDLYIDKEDVAMLNQIIDGKMTWDKKKAPFADADQDGKITSKDVDLVKKIIDKEKCTVYYLDYYDEVEKVNFPLVDRNIAVTYYQQAEACNILGLMDNIKCASLAAAGQYCTLYPHLKTLTDNQKFGTTGSSTLNDDAIEKIIANNVTVIVSTPSTQNYEPTKALREDKGIDTINLWYNGAYCYSTLMTMGIFMDRIDKVEDYMDFCDDVVKKITSKISDKDKKDILLMDSYYASSAKYSFIASDANGSFTMINRYLANVYSADDASQFGFVQRDIEWLTANQAKYDAVVIAPTPCGFRDLRVDGTYQPGEYYSRTDYNAQCEAQFETLERTNAHKNGNLIITSYDNTFGYSTYAMLPIIAAQLYPDLFSLEDGLEILQDWFDNINKADIDVDKQGAFSYTGSVYKVSYPQVEKI